jgi:hypothetical protein
MANGLQIIDKRKHMNISVTDINSFTGNILPMAMPMVG